ncbi:MAG: putative RNA-dependent RNA polymerase [Serbia narna-like virus 3]|nr:MAG: putative RNA-dependent RNA polymerase [Serbia narna-like virus 3]
MDENADLLTSTQHPAGSVEPEETEELEYQVRRTTREVFALATERGWSPGRRTMLPSQHASFEYPRSKGGAFSLLLPSDPLSALGLPFLLGFVTTRTRQTPVYGPFDPEETRRALGPDLSRSLERIRVRRAPILEPFKVRVVSAGQAVQYQLARAHQPSLWGMLAATDVCRLVGTPFSVEDVEACFRLPRESGIYSYMVSGDYKSATDCLDPLLSEAAMDEYCSLVGASTEERLLLLRALTGHVMEDGRLQHWGQLMGSPVSFPILCLVNLAVTRFVMEEEYRMFIPLSWSPLRVNGDDILFPLPPGGYHRWCHWVTVAGLVPSVGKNYFSREYCMLNSKMYRLPRDWDRATDERPTLVPQINLGLIRGPSRAHAHQTLSEWICAPEAPWSPWNLKGSMEEALLGWEGSELRPRIETACLRAALPLLRSLPALSWFAAPDLGGLGLPTSRPAADVIREHHLRIAALMSVRAHTLGREDLIFLRWGHLGGPSFSRMALTEYMDASLRVGARWQRLSLSVPKVDTTNSRLLSSLLRSFAPVGLEHMPESASERGLLSQYHSTYKKLCRAAERAASSLSPMSPVKAKQGLDFRWELEEVRWA